MISLSHSLFDDFLTYSLFKSRCFSITHSLSLSFLLYLYILVSLSLSLFFYLSIILTHTFSIPFGHSSSRILHSSCHFFTNVASSSLSLFLHKLFKSILHRTHTSLPTYLQSSLTITKYTSPSHLRSKPVPNHTLTHLFQRSQK